MRSQVYVSGICRMEYALARQRNQHTGVTPGCKRAGGAQVSCGLRFLRSAFPLGCCRLRNDAEQDRMIGLLANTMDLSFTLDLAKFLSSERHDDMNIWILS
jgi:hypothetical protein